MKLSELSRRVSAGGMKSWAVHSRAMERRCAGEEIIVLSIGQDTNASPPEAVIEQAVQSLRGGRHH